MIVVGVGNCIHRTGGDILMLDRLVDVDTEARIRRAITAAGDPTGSTVTDVAIDDNGNATVSGFLYDHTGRPHIGADGDLARYTRRVTA